MIKKTNMFVFIWLLTMALLSGCASKPASVLNEGVVAQVTQYGIYTTQGPTVKRHYAYVPNETMSANMQVSFERQTDWIPGVVGTRFGLRFEITGLPRASIAELQTVVIHPPIKGANGQVTKRSFWPSYVPVGDDGVGRSMIGYIIEEPYEIAPGDWIFEIKRGGEVILRQKFLVYLPKK